MTEKNTNPIKKSDSVNQSDKTKKKIQRSPKKTRLFSRLNINIPIPPVLMMILPSFSAKAEQQSNDISADKSMQNHQPDSKQHGLVTPISSNDEKHSSNPAIELNEPSPVAETIIPAPIHSSHHLSASPSAIVSFVANMPSTNNVFDNSPAELTLSPLNTPIPKATALAPITYAAEVIVGKYGSLKVDRTGKYTFTLDPHSPDYISLQSKEHATDSFTTHLSNGSTAVIHVPVQGLQNIPTISGDLSGSLVEDKNVDNHGLLKSVGKIDVVDADHDQSGLQAETLHGKFGTLSINKEGHWQYLVDNNQGTIQALTSKTSLSETFTVHTTDGTPQTIKMTIGGHDDNALITGTDSASTTEDLKLTASGKLDITDSDAGEAHFSDSDIIGTLGTLHLADNGAWTYDLDNSNPIVQALGQGSSSTDIITVHSADGTAHQINITVNGSNDIPVIGTITAKTVDEGSPLIRGLVGALDVDHGDTITYSTPLSHPGFVLNTDGSYSLDPTDKSFDHLAVGEHQTLTIPVIATDNHGGNSISQNLVITINGTNDIPVIGTIITKTVDEGQPAITGKITASDVDHGDTTTFSTPFSHPGFVLNTDGSYSLDPTDKSFDHLAVGEHQTLTIPVIATDNHGGASTSQNLVFTINGTNDLPIVSGVISGSVIEAGAINAGTDSATGNLTATDPDTGDSLHWGVLKGQGSYGTMTIDQHGQWHYLLSNNNPATNALTEGQSVQETFTITATDSSGHPIQQVVTVGITGANDLPVINTSVVANIKEAGSATTGIASATSGSNVTDPDKGDTVTWAIPQGQGSYGAMTIDQSGQWHYTLDNTNPVTNALHEGEHVHETFTITATDSSGTPVQQIITVNITGSNDLPIIAGTSTGAVVESGSSGAGIDAATGRLTATDPDNGDTLIWQVPPAQGIYGSMTIDQHGQWHYSLDNNLATTGALTSGQHAYESITVTATDSSGNPVQQVIRITVTGSGDVAVISGVDTGSVYEDAKSAIYSDPNYDLSVSGQLNIIDLDTGEAHFLRPATHSIWYVGDHGGQLIIGPTGSWTYDMPNGSHVVQNLGAGESFVDTVTVRSVDGTTHDIAITIHGTNDVPVVSGTVTLTSGMEDTNYTLRSSDLLANTSDVDHNDAGQLSVHGLQALKADGTLAGTIIDNHDGSYTFKPEGDYNGSVEFKYDVQDTHGGSTSASASLNLKAVNDAAVITGQDSGDVKEDISVGPVVAGNANMIETHGQMHISDPDAGENHFHFKDYAYIHDAGHPEFHPIVSSLGGYLSIGADGSWNYRIDTRKSVIQNLGEGESTTDTATVTSIDGTSHVVTVTIHGTNDAPFCSSEVQLKPGSEDTDIILTSAQLLANSSDIDTNDLGLLTVANLSADHGTITANTSGSFTFHPDKDYNGQVHFSYDVKDGHGGATHTGATTSLSAMSDVTDISGVDTASTTEDLKLTASGKLDITDSDAGEAHFSDSDIIGTLGTLHLTDNGAWTYDLDNNNPTIQTLGQGASTTDIITVHSADGTQHQISITVNGTNDIPILNHISSKIVIEGQATITGQITSTDIDQGDKVTYSTPSAHSGFVLNPNGTYSLDPTDKSFNHLAVGEHETLMIPVIATDNHSGDSVSQNLVITVTGTNDDPVLSVNQTTNTTGTLAETDLDTNDTHTFYTTNGAGYYGTLTVDPATGVYTYAQNPSVAGMNYDKTTGTYSGKEVFAVEVKDNNGGTDTKYITMDVTATVGAGNPPVITTAVTTPPTVSTTQPPANTTTTTPPTNVVTIDLTSTSDSGSSATDNLTNDNTPNISGHTDIPFSKVEIMENGKVIATATSDANGDYNVDTPTLNDASHTLTARAMAPSATSPVTSPNLDVVVDTTITATVTVADITTDNIINATEAGSTVAVTGTVGGDVQNGDTVTLTIGTQSHTGTVTNGAYSIDVPGSELQGVTSIGASVTTTDTAGNSATSTATHAYSEDTSATAGITVDSITQDNVINSVESGGQVDVTGSVSGDVKDGDTVTLHVNGKDVTGTVNANGKYSIAVDGADLKADSHVQASVTATDAAGNTQAATSDHTYSVDTHVGMPTITFENPGSDNQYSKAEIAQGHAGTITATVHAPSDAQIGEHLNINGVDHILDTNNLAHGIALEVAPSSIVKAIMTDEYGNTNSALNMAANAKPEPIVVTAPQGSHHIGASLGIPTLIPAQTPVPINEQGWKILVNGHYLTHSTSQWGTLSIDPKTGHLSYQEHADTHTGPHGSATNVGVHEDKFEVALQGSHHDDVIMHVQVSILSHGPGNSGKLTLGSEVVDMTITPVIAHQPVAPTQHDEPEIIDNVNVDITTFTEDQPIDAIAHEYQHSESHPVTGAAAYLDALGITPVAPVNDAPQHQLPADMDIVMAEADHVALGHDDVSHMDLSDALEHQAHEHDLNPQDHDDTQHHHQVDDLPEIDPIDPNS